MTRIPHEGKSSFLRKSRRFCGFEAKNYPLESPKSLFGQRFRHDPSAIASPAHAEPSDPVPNLFLKFGQRRS
jgi:hypothetical protein